jgi:hypothetical protein
MGEQEQVRVAWEAQVSWVEWEIHVALQPSWKIVLPAATMLSNRLKVFPEREAEG